MLDEANTGGVILLIVGGITLLLAGGVLVLRSRTKEAGPDIPRIMRPGPADPALETNNLQKLQGWGVILVAFFVIWIPITWLREPSQNLQQEENLKTQAIARGQAATNLFTETNQLGVGCVRCHGPELRGMMIQSGDKFVQSANLTTVCGGNLIDPPHPNITSIDDIYQVIEEGRNGVMPSWSIRFEGALDDQQINDLVNYLVAMSSKNVPYKDNVCINPDAVKRAQEKALAAGTVLEQP
jgi:mono/diheme cytochrome c family protein